MALSFVEMMFQFKFVDFLDGGDESRLLFIFLIRIREQRQGTGSLAFALVIHYEACFLLYRSFLVLPSEQIS